MVTRRSFLLGASGLLLPQEPLIKRAWWFLGGNNPLTAPSTVAFARFSMNGDTFECPMIEEPGGALAGTISITQTGLLIWDSVVNMDGTLRSSVGVARNLADGDIFTSRLFPATYS